MAYIQTRNRHGKKGKKHFLGKTGQDLLVQYRNFEFKRRV